MVNQNHVELLNEGVESWNRWREQNPGVRPMLSGTQLGGLHLEKVNLDSADLFGADLRGAHLRGANLHKAHLREADLTKADLRGCNLRGAHFREARLTGADVRGADLSFATLVMTKLKGTKLTGSSVYGVSAWDVDADETTAQAGLVISKHGEPVVTVDNLEVAQFISLLLNNQKIRDVIDTVGRKGVLILGRFKPERKAVLDAVKEKLREHGYLPILFDFDVPESRDITETVTLLARLAKFIIADLTEPSSIPKELEAIVPSLAVPVQPLLEGDEASNPYSMFKDYWKYDWVLKVHRYEGLEGLMSSLEESVIVPAEAKVRELAERRGEATA